MFSVLLFLLFSFNVSAQDQSNNSIFKEVKRSNISIDEQKKLPVGRYRVFKINLNQLSVDLKTAPHRNNTKIVSTSYIKLPQIDGTMKQYRVMENNTLSRELSDKFPEIKTYDGYSIDNTNELVKFDLTPQGFHAMILKAGASPVFIDPINRDKTPYYIIYRKQDLHSPKHMKCGVKSQSTALPQITHFKHFADFNSCELKTYRLAMAATAQYTQYQGGTVPLALAAEATTMNRVNGVYETDMAITMQLIADNNLIIYTNPNAQPYTSGNPKVMIIQNQTNIDAVIGTAHYDIGHVVDAAGSGLASLGSVCDASRKARGVTGRADPSGDAFDIDYVAHEMGHQFGANHVQNNDCERYEPTAVEPGSGSTIMGYAGICAPNVQLNSDAYFNGISLQEMGEFVSESTHNCAVKSAIPSAPVINSTNGFSTVPANTPFALTAAATEDGNTGVITYTWEQMNNEISEQPPVSNATGGPNFRSLPPQTSGTRFFPNLISLANNGPFTWEVIPSVSRTMNFRVTARRNTPNGSCNAYTDVTLTTDESAGPFVVTYPDEMNISWEALTNKIITWNVARTNQQPVGELFVDILLSTDGGQSYPYTLMSAANNAGSQTICVPNMDTAHARVMVKASNGTFFNISHNNFSINAVPPRAPQLIRASRNRMSTKEAFVIYAGCIPPSTDVYTINGLPDATIQIDTKNNRFLIGNITTPKRAVITITATDENNISRTSNPIIIPSIL